MMEPFHTLFKGNAPREMSLKLLYQGTVYRWFPIKALFKGYYLLSLVGFSSILADILTVMVSTFSANTMPSPGSPEDDVGDETHKSFLGSVTLSIVLLSILILCAALVYALRRHPFLPSQPSTIAAVLAFTHALRMLYDFVNAEKLNNLQVEKILKQKGKRYRLGCFKGRDSQIHCAVDEEPMRSRNKHGVSYTMAQNPWSSNHGRGHEYHHSMSYSYDRFFFAFCCRWRM
jgi:Protein of unknown function (DUF3433)